jgi:CRISPR-associated endoribonuclease Cas6
VIGQADQQFAAFLHDKGFSFGYKRFKLFTFSGLQGKPFEIFPREGRIAFNTNELNLEISFWMPKAAEHFILGLFKRQQFSLGDRLNQVDLLVSRIEALPRPWFKEVMQYKLSTPAVLSNKEEGNPNKQYLDPAVENRYPDYFLKNLLEKARAIKLNVQEPIGIGMEEPFGGCNFRLVGTSRRKGIHIKEHQAGHSQVIGYLYHFELEAPVELQELGYYAGFGEENAMGFGMWKVTYNKYMKDAY